MIEIPDGDSISLDDVLLDAIPAAWRGRAGAGRASLRLASTSQRIDEGARWTEHLRVEPPLQLDPAEAPSLLDALLAEKGRDADLPAER